VINLQVANGLSRALAPAILSGVLGAVRSFGAKLLSPKPAGRIEYNSGNNAKARADTDANRRPLPRPASTDQRGSNASLARRLEIALARNRELSADNQRLRRQLAAAIGRLRAAGIATEDAPPIT
jgi:hypothetical protein